MSARNQLIEARKFADELEVRLSSLAGDDPMFSVIVNALNDAKLHVRALRVQVKLEAMQTALASRFPNITVEINYGQAADEAYLVLRVPMTSADDVVRALA